MFNKVCTVVLFCIIQILSGCVGIASFTEHSKNSTRFPVPFLKVGHYGTQPTEVFLQDNRLVSRPIDPSRITKQKLINIWGEPDSIEYIKGGRTIEQWIYNREIGWSGIVVFIGIPIPLLVPVGYRNTILTIENGIVIKGEFFEGDLDTTYVRFPPFIR